QTARESAENAMSTSDVQDAFKGDGSQIGESSTSNKRWEVNNNTSLALGRHAIKFGARFRGVRIDSISPQNFGGTWTFSGSRRTGNPNGFTSIQVFQITQQGLANGLTPAQIRAAGGGANQFTIAAGNPAA